MKNKKGFTVIEIIVSLTIILLIGGTVIGLTITNKKQKEEKVLEVTKKIQEAAGVYLSINKEIDSTIEQNILNGGTGYVIPLKTLLDNGYIGNNHIKILTDNISDFKINKHYMLAGVFSKTTQCDNNQSTITIQASYDLENESNEYYLCNFTTEKLYVYYDLEGGHFTDGTQQLSSFIKGGSPDALNNGTKVKKDDISNIRYTFKEWRTAKDCGGDKVTGIDNQNNNIIYACYEKTELEQEPTYKTIVSSTKFTNNFNKIAVSQEWCDANPGVDKTNIVCNENGIYTYYNETDNITYYYARGAIKNNYLKYKDKLWRIVWINDKNEMKIVLDDEVNVKINGNINVSAGQSLYHLMDSKVSTSNISQDDFNNLIDSYPYGIFTSSLDFWYLSGSNAVSKELVKTSETFRTVTAEYRITYDLSETFSITDNKPYYYTGYYNNYYNNYYQYNQTYNIYYKTMYEMTKNYKDSFLLGMSNFCYPVDLRNKTTTSMLTCTKINLSSSTVKNNVTSAAKVTYLTMDELKMAGVGTYLENEGMDNYILPEDNDAFFIADYQQNWDWDYVYSNYYISKFGVKNGAMFNYDRETCAHYKYSMNSSDKGLDRIYSVFYKNGSCKNAYCMSGDYCEHDYGGTYYDYYILKHNKTYKFNFNANAVKPALLIDLNAIKLSNNTGTSNDPYELVK